MLVQTLTFSSLIKRASNARTADSVMIFPANNVSYIHARCLRYQHTFKFPLIESHLQLALLTRLRAFSPATFQQMLQLLVFRELIIVSNNDVFVAHQSTNIARTLR